MRQGMQAWLAASFLAHHALAAHALATHALATHVLAERVLAEHLAAAEIEKGSPDHQDQQCKLKNCHSTPPSISLKQDTPSHIADFVALVSNS